MPVLDDTKAGAATTRIRGSDGRRTRGSILAAALSIFAEKGFSGANVADIVAAAQTTKPMIYYHFGSKEGLFAAVLEHVYEGMRAFEQSLHLDALPPVPAMARLVQASFDYHAAHPDWIRLISTANIHEAKHIKSSATIAAKNLAIVEITAGLLARGAADGVFRDGIDPLHLHLMIASMSFYRVSNRHTWRVIFHRDLGAPDDAARQRAMLTEAVLAYLRPVSQ
jgi:AcrR family transcriptional regulator